MIIYWSNFLQGKFLTSLLQYDTSSRQIKLKLTTVSKAKSLPEANNYLIGSHKIQTTRMLLLM